MLNPTHLILTHLLLVAPVGAGQTTRPTCPPAGMNRADLVSLKSEKFAIESPELRSVIALRLLSCLDDPDPAIRDGVVFEGLSKWLRGKALPPATIVSLEESLRKTLAGEKDAAGFRLPFAALVLSEVVRTDRIEPMFSDAVRAGLVELASTSLSQVTDYRGFDNVEGWRHGVAHGSDLVLQLALNPRVGADGLRRMLGAIASQVAPRGPVFYTFGEPGRLANAVVFTYKRGLVDPQFWETWIAELASPKPFPDWGSAFQSVDGLAKRHNTLAFLHALSFAARAQGDDALKTLAALADKAASQI